MQTTVDFYHSSVRLCAPALGRLPLFWHPAWHEIPRNFKLALRVVPFVLTHGQDVALKAYSFTTALNGDAKKSKNYQYQVNIAEAILTSLFRYSLFYFMLNSLQYKLI